MRSGTKTDPFTRRAAPLLSPGWLLDDEGDALERPPAARAPAAAPPPPSPWRALRGLHAVLGVAGTGKTTLVVKVALAARAAGRRAAIVALDPEPLRVAPLLEMARARGLALACAAGRTEWEAALAHFAGCDVVLVDTPCIRRGSTPEHLRALAELRHPQSVLHHTLCPHHDARFVAEQLQRGAELGVDRWALTQVDLGGAAVPPPPDAAAVSFVNASARLDDGGIGFGAGAALRLGSGPGD